MVGRMASDRFPMISLRADVDIVRHMNKCSINASHIPFAFDIQADVPRKALK